MRGSNLIVLGVWDMNMLPPLSLPALHCTHCLHRLSLYCIAGLICLSGRVALQVQTYLLSLSAGLVLVSIHPLVLMMPRRTRLPAVPLVPSLVSCICQRSDMSSEP